MANENLTIFQRLNTFFRGSSNNSVPDIVVKSPDNSARNQVLFTTNDRSEYERRLETFKQQKYLAYQWKKAGADNALESLAGYNAVKLMYRDVDLMDGTCEIGSALDIISEEACPINSEGIMLNVYSKSQRTKSILEDLFVNRLHIYTELPMIARHLCKYGNTFELLNIDKDNGIMGWMMMPVYEVDREENGYGSTYTQTVPQNTTDIKPDEIRFVWKGHNGDNPYFNWQVAHFRLLNDSFFLPYGVSMLHKARRAWRMWSMMEDAMLIWRLDKAIERRVFKIYVGAIDDSDVPAYINEIANNFKRTQIIDPMTGQIDLRKNFLDVSSDYFIPVRREDAPNPIETLQGANSQVQMEDIEYMQNKIFAAMRVPKTFLNFQEAQGKGQNLSFLDIRFSRMINRIQQFLLMELNKIAMIHLYLMGLQDEIGNFSLTLNNPSSQIEAQEIDDLQKRLTALQTALADPGTGIPMMSIHMALKKIMKMSDSEIRDMFNEIRLEKAMAAELQATANIIKHTGMFDITDRIYGDYNAMHGQQQQQPAQGEDDALGGGGGGGAPISGDLGGEDMDIGEPGADDTGDLGGETGVTDMTGAPEADNGGTLMENGHKKLVNEAKSFTKKYFDLLAENSKSVKNKPKSFTDLYFGILSENQKEVDGTQEEPVDYDVKNHTLHMNIEKICERIDKLIDKDELEREAIINEAIEDLSDLSGKTVM
jgi:hypothetical protein